MAPQMSKGACLMYGIEPAGSHRLTRREQAYEAEIVGRPMLPRSVERPLVTAVAKQYARGVYETVRIETTSHVARFAMSKLHDLKEDERAAIASDAVSAGSH